MLLVVVLRRLVSGEASMSVTFRGLSAPSLGMLIDLRKTPQVSILDSYVQVIERDIFVSSRDVVSGTLLVLNSTIGNWHSNNMSSFEYVRFVSSTVEHLFRDGLTFRAHAGTQSRRTSLLFQDCVIRQWHRNGINCDAGRCNIVLDGSKVETMFKSAVRLQAPGGLVVTRSDIETLKSGAFEDACGNYLVMKGNVFTRLNESSFEFCPMNFAYKTVIVVENIIRCGNIRTRWSAAFMKKNYGIPARPLSRLLSTSRCANTSAAAPSLREYVLTLPPGHRPAPRANTARVESTTPSGVGGPRLLWTAIGSTAALVTGTLVGSCVRSRLRVRLHRRPSHGSPPEAATCSSPCGRMTAVQSTSMLREGNPMPSGGWVEAGQAAAIWSGNPAAEFCPQQHQSIQNQPPPAQAKPADELVYMEMTAPRHMRPLIPPQGRPDSADVWSSQEGRRQRPPQYQYHLYANVHSVLRPAPTTAAEPRTFSNTNTLTLPRDSNI